MLLYFSGPLPTPDSRNWIFSSDNCMQGLLEVLTRNVVAVKYDILICIGLLLSIRLLRAVGFHAPCYSFQNRIDNLLQNASHNRDQHLQKSQSARPQAERSTSKIEKNR